MRATRWGSRNGGATGRTGRPTGRGGRGTRGGLGGFATEGTAIRIVARGPARTVGALIHWTLVPVMSEAVTRVARLVIPWMSGGEGDLRVSSSPPGLYTLEDAFFVGHRGGDVRGGGAGGEGGDEGRGRVRGVAT